MNYTQKKIDNSVLEHSLFWALPPKSECSSTPAVGTLTIYKEVVDTEEDWIEIIKERHS